MVFDNDINDSLFGGGESPRNKLEERMLATKLKATLDAKARSFNELCFDVCVDKTGSKLDQKTATCLSNCVDRFFDVTLFIGERFLQTLQNNATHS